VQLDPIKPKLKPPGTKRLKLEYDGLLSNFAFNCNLRRYNMGPVHHAARVAAFEAGVSRALAAGSTLLCGGRVIGANFVVGPLIGHRLLKMSYDTL
jgi:hypothetical protein